MKENLMGFNIAGGNGAVEIRFEQRAREHECSQEISRFTLLLISHWAEQRGSRSELGRGGSRDGSRDHFFIRSFYLNV